METPSAAFPRKLDRKTVTIANGASLSGAIDLGAGTLVGIEMPAAWDAADLTFQTSSDNTAFQDYYDAAGTEVTVSADASRNIKLDAADYAGAGQLKVRSGTSDTPVNQTAERTIVLILRVL